MNLKLGKFFAVAWLVLSNIVYLPTLSAQKRSGEFQVVETSVDAVHVAMKSGKLTSHQLVQLYLDRIAAYDKTGPTINCIITLNPSAMEEADRLDAEYKKRGFVGHFDSSGLFVQDTPGGIKPIPHGGPLSLSKFQHGSQPVDIRLAAVRGRGCVKRGAGGTVDNEIKRPRQRRQIGQRRGDGVQSF